MKHVHSSRLVVSVSVHMLIHIHVTVSDWDRFVSVTMGAWSQNVLERTYATRYVNMHETIIKMY